MKWFYKNFHNSGMVVRLIYSTPHLITILIFYLLVYNTSSYLNYLILAQSAVMPSGQSPTITGSICNFFVPELVIVIIFLYLVIVTELILWNFGNALFEPFEVSGIVEIYL